MFVLRYLKSVNILYSDILQKPFIVISACRTYTGMRCLTTGIRSEKCIIRRCRHVNMYLRKPR